MVGIGNIGGGHDPDVGEKSAAKITHLYENGWHGGDAPRASVKPVETHHGTSLQAHGYASLWLQKNNHYLIFDNLFVSAKTLSHTKFSDGDSHS